MRELSHGRRIVTFPGDMIGVGLVIDPGCDFESRNLATQLERAAGGLRVDRFELPPAGVTPASIRRFARRIREREVKVIHAVGPDALLAAAMVGCQPIVYSPPPHEPTRGVGRLRWTSTIRAVRVVTNSPRAARAFPNHDVSVIAPLPSVKPESPITRGELGLGDADRVLLTVGESTRSARHEAVVHAAVIAHFLDRRYRLLLWGEGPTTDRVRRLAESLRVPDFFVIASDRLPKKIAWPALPPLADLAIDAAVGARCELPGMICRDQGIGVLETGRLSPREAAQAIGRSFEQLHSTVADAHRTRPLYGRIEDWIGVYEDALVGRRSDGTAMRVATVPV